MARNCPKKHGFFLVRRLWEMFNGVSGETRRRKIEAIAATRQLGGSKNTLHRVRLALGVESKKVAGKFYWFYPKYSLQEALDVLNTRKSKAGVYKDGRDQANIDARNARYVDELVDGFHDIFSQTNYDIPSVDFKRELKAYFGRTYSGTVMYKAKRKANIISVMRDRRWHLIMAPAPAIQEWLEEQLLDGPLPRKKLLEQAFTEKGWGETVMLHQISGIRGLTGPIHYFYKDGKCIWYDINVWYPHDETYLPPKHEVLAADRATQKAKMAAK